MEAAFEHRQPVNPADGDAAELASLSGAMAVAQQQDLRAQTVQSAPRRRRGSEGGQFGGVTVGGFTGWRCSNAASTWCSQRSALGSPTRAVLLRAASLLRNQQLL